MTSPVFISYRRADSQHPTARLFDRLAPRYLAPAEVFMDIEAIAAGADFPVALKNQLKDCRVCLVMIGPSWLDQRDGDGRRRIDNPADFVRQEIAEALSRNITVIPVLLDNAKMPAPGDLPDVLKPLASRNAISLLSDRFDRDADVIAAKVLHALGRSEDSELDLIKLLFSFKGTISRKQYWLGLGIITLVAIGIVAGLLAAFGVPVLKGLLDPGDLPRQQKLITQLGTLWIWWPTMALAWKRIKDLGHGMGLFVPVLGAGIAQIGFDLAGLTSEASALSLVCLMMLLGLGTLKGTRFIAHNI